MPRRKNNDVLLATQNAPSCAAIQLFELAQGARSQRVLRLRVAEAARVLGVQTPHALEMMCSKLLGDQAPGRRGIARMWEGRLSNDDLSNSGMGLALPSLSAVAAALDATVRSSAVLIERWLVGGVVSRAEIERRIMADELVVRTEDLYREEIVR